MKPNRIILLCVFVCLTWCLNGRAENGEEKTPGHSVNAAGVTIPVPKAVAKNPRLQLDSVLEDTVITHDFIIENSGNAPLVIEKVKTSCGCTTADFTREIAPNAQGKISIRGKTRGYAGRVFSKTITVFTNDPANRQITLSISAPVEAFAEVEPNMIRLQGVAGQTIMVCARIIPSKKYPFTISKTDWPELEKKISCTLTKEKEVYLLTVENLMKTAGTYRGRIILKTDSSVKPEIDIYVFGVIGKDHT